MSIDTKKHSHAQHWLALLSLAIFFWMGAPASGQATAPQGPPTTMPQQDQDRPTVMPPDNDMRRWQIARMDQFLDSHPEIAEQLRKNPSLINNEEFVEKHPELQEFVQKHPGIREEFSENPSAFMNQEQQFDRREGERGRAIGDRDAARSQVTIMDQFLDSHPEVAEQLRKNPSLINNEEFVEKHPELQQFLQQHPGVREQFSENPNAFMNREQRFDQREEMQNRETTDRGRLVDRDNRAEAASFGQFLNGHASIARELSKDPTLANNKEFLESHGELKEFLNAHPTVKENMSANPQAFLATAQQATHATTMKEPAIKPRKHR